MSSPSSPGRRRSNQGTHTLASFSSLIDVILWTRSRSQVVHNRGHGFSKRFNPAGVYQLPITRLRTYARLHLVGDAPEVPKRQVPLTNNAQFRVAPGESTSNSKAGRALELVSTVCLGFGLPDHPGPGPGPQPAILDQQNMPSHLSGLF